MAADRNPDSLPDFMTPEGMSQLAADELALALTGVGAKFNECYGFEDGDVSLSFPSIFHAEVMMVSAFKGPEGPGSLYDRAVGSCVTMNALRVLSAVADKEVPEDVITAAFEEGWTWMVHPDMKNAGHVGWHVSVTIPGADALAVAALLNATRNGVTA